MAGASVTFGPSGKHRDLNYGVIVKTSVTTVILNAGCLIKFTVSTVVTAFPLEDHNRLALTVKAWEYFKYSEGISQVS